METNPIQSAGRIFSVIELLAEEGAMGVTLIGVRLGLKKSTVHRLLASLISMGYIKKDAETKKYYMTFKIVQIAESIMNRIDVVSRIHPYLKELSDACGETVHLVQRDNDEVIYIDKVESTTGSIRMASRIGYSLPLFVTGVGKALLAQMKEEEVEKLWKNAEIKPLTQYTITDFAAMKQELELIRQRRYALDNEENEIGVRCIASVIADHTGRTNLAFSISAPVSRLTVERVPKLAEMVIDYSLKMKGQY